MMVPHPVFAPPLLSNRFLSRVIDEIGKVSAERWIPWTIKLSTMGLDDSEKEVLQELFAFLFRQLQTVEDDLSPLVHGFQTFLLDHRVGNPIHVLATLAQFEETAGEIVRRNFDKNGAEQACAWLRSLTLNLKYAAFELLYLPAGPIPDNGRGWTPPFARLLNRTAPREQWEWVALFTSSPRIRILDLAVRDGENFEWKAAARTPELTRQVVTGIENNHPAVLRETVVSGIGLAAGGAAHPAARHRLVQIAQWLQLVFDLSAHLKYCSPETDRLHLYEAVLQFDESLLQCRDLQDVMTSTVEHVCRIGGFRRSALFWYTPLTRTVEGVHAFNLRKEDILRIREPADNLSGVQEVVKTTKPVYFENVTHRLPDHYVKTFRLTSLVACPIPVSPQRPTAILLLDQDGMPFHPDERTITLLDTLLSRVSKTIHARLLGPLTKTEIPSSSVLTRREQQILQLIADGLDTKEISKHLHLSEYTVSEYVGTILRKLRATNRSEAVAKALRQHLIH